MRITGLSSFEAKKKLNEFGENIVYGKRKLNPVILFFKKFNSPLLIILIVVSIVSYFLGERTNALIIISMVLISGIMDFINSFKSEKAVEKLVAKVLTKATVLRDGQKKKINLREIVPGDVAFLSAGDVIPADSFVLEAKDFFVNQSALTGESFPVEKYDGTEEKALKEFTPENESAVFMGTNAVTGFATIKVLKTGRETEFGKILKDLSERSGDTEFEKSIKSFSYFIMKLNFLLVGIVLLINALLGRGILESFIFAVAIAIGLTPELLPVIMSVSLSRGSIKMAEKNVIVKKLSAIQNFGSMNILCTDKTGTLTEDKIVLIKHIDAKGEDSEDVLLYSYINSAYHTGVKNPLDRAISEHKKLDISGFKKIDEVPFDFTRRRDSLVVESGGEKVLITKGAPESIFDVCAFYRNKDKNLKFDSETKKNVLERFRELSRDGFRVLALAIKKLDPDDNDYQKDDEKEMIFMGFTAFLDPPKKDVADTIEKIKKLGIEIKILTGDNEILTEKICRDIDLKIKGIILGTQLNSISDSELKILARKITVFARITPEQKERVITVLRKSGHAVGYLGDGINDAPALKAADIGISVNNAVDVAKDTADIILMKKSLEVLKDGVKEGRRTFENTLKYIMMGLSSNFGNMFSMMGASAFLPFLPMLPPQILLNNFLYDMSQLSLPADNVDESEIEKPPRWNLDFIKKFMIVFGPVSSLFDFLTFGLLYFVFRLGQSQFQTGWFIESLTTQVLVIYFIRTRKLPFIQSRPSLALVINTVLMVAIAWLIPFSPLGRLFQFGKLSFLILISVIFIVVAYLVLVEIVKRIFYKFVPKVCGARMLK